MNFFINNLQSILFSAKMFFLQKNHPGSASIQRINKLANLKPSLVGNTLHAGQWQLMKIYALFKLRKLKDARPQRHLVEVVS